MGNTGGRFVNVGRLFHLEVGKLLTREARSNVPYAWRHALRLAFGGLSVIVLSSPALGQSYDLNHIFVYYNANLLTPPPGKAGGTPDEFSYGEEQIHVNLTELGVVRLDRALPSFTHESVNAVSISGEALILPNDLTDLYVVEIADTNVTAMVSTLSADTSSVRFAEPIYVGRTDFAPTDSLYEQQWGLENTGQYQWGVSGEDIRASAAWGITTGQSQNVTVGILDTGMNISHEDLSLAVDGGSFVGGSSADVFGHGTKVASIVAARGGNRLGVAGVNWGATPVNLKVCTNSGDCNVDALIRGIEAARGAGIPVLNMSLHVDGLSYALLYTCQNAHATGMLLVASMGNLDHRDKVYPAGFHQTVEAVGAVFMDGSRWRNNAISNCSATDGGSNFGDWIDIVAPGGRMIATADPNGGYAAISPAELCTDGFSGVSAAVPVISGVASLIKSFRPELAGDDLAQVIARTARDKGPTGFDEEYGSGVVNAESALKYVGGGKAIERGIATDLTYMGVVGTGYMEVTGTKCYSTCSSSFFPLVYFHRHEYRGWVAFTSDFNGPPDAWARNGQSTGWSSELIHREPDRASGWGGVIPGSTTADGCSVITYLYELWPCNLQAGPFWCPAAPPNAKVAWTAIGHTRNVPDITQSFFVPQAGTTTSPVEGTSATNLFRACPNNDGGASLFNNARVKVVIRDSNGVGIPGIAAQDIYLAFNGGTPELAPTGQEFRGVGADSIIANGKYNVSPSCPDVRVIYADAPTDATGSTYITLRGASATPGVAARDPNRKWGHYDSEIPVYVYWQQLTGRLTSGSPNPAYVLQIKNFDFFGGLDTEMSVGEWVGPAEYNWVMNNMGASVSDDPEVFWRDFDGDGQIGPGEANMMVAHVSHDCDTPNLDP